MTQNPYSQILKIQPLIVIFYTKLQEKLPPLLEEEYLKLLSPELWKKNQSYKFWEDRHRHLFGVLLLLKAHRLFDSNNDIINAIKYNSYKRPMLDGDLDFNISHSKNYIVCAMAKNIKVGIDVEEHVPIDFKDFHITMNAQQWKTIHDSEQPIKTFFDFWTIKESVIKADGRGMYANLQDIEFLEDKAYIDDCTWQLKQLNLFEEASLCVASDRESSIKLHEINFYNNKAIEEYSITNQAALS